MKLDFTGRHFTITPAIKKHAKEQAAKIEKILGGKDLRSAHFTLSVEKIRHKAELLVAWRDQELSSTATTTDMYLALTQAVEKMERQAHKLKDKLSTKRKTSPGLKGVAVAEPAAADAKDGGKKARIVRSRKYAVKPMTPEEAVYDLGGLEDQFIVFRNVESDSICVAYKRKDGNYGLIEP